MQYFSKAGTFQTFKCSFRLPTCRGALHMFPRRAADFKRIFLITSSLRYAVDVLVILKWSGFDNMKIYLIGGETENLN